MRVISVNLANNNDKKVQEESKPEAKITQEEHAPKPHATCNVGRIEFVDKLKKVKTACSKDGPSDSVFHYIALKALTDRQELTIRATGLTLTIKATIKTGVFEDGECLVEPKKLEKMLKGLKGNILILSIGETLHIESGNQRRNVFEVKSGLPTEADCPKSKFSLPEDVLKQMVDKTAYAASDENTRPIFTTNNFKISKGKMKIAATDGKRIAETLTDVNTKDSLEFNLPAEHLRTLTKLLNNNGNTRIAYGEKDVVFLTDDGYRVDIMMVAGRFPVVEKVMDKQADYTITINRKEFIEALKPLKVISKEEPFNRMLLEVGADKIVCSARHFELGEMFETIEDVTYHGQPFKMAYDLVCLLEVLSSIGDTNVDLQVMESENGINNDQTFLLPTDQPDGFTQKALLMPLRFKHEEKQ